MDARKLPSGWKSAGFDDSSWGRAQILRSIHIGGFARTQPPADPYGPLYRRWSQFLVGGYDTIGECWCWGTHVHGWSCTPTRDMVFYTLGVTPQEPGYTKARIAPRLGGLTWVKGKIPTPHGVICVYATPEKVIIDSPIPVAVDLENKPLQDLPAGHHEL